MCRQLRKWAACDLSTRLDPSHVELRCWPSQEVGRGQVRYWGTSSLSVQNLSKSSEITWSLISLVGRWSFEFQLRLSSRLKRTGLGCWLSKLQNKLIFKWSFRLPVLFRNPYARHYLNSHQVQFGDSLYSLIGPVIPIHHLDFLSLRRRVACVVSMQLPTWQAPLGPLSPSGCTMATRTPPRCSADWSRSVGTRGRSTT